VSPNTLQGLIVFMFLIILVGGFIFAIIAFVFRQRLRELAIKERIAMIEKGLIPSPEIDPGRFEMLAGMRRPFNQKAERYRSAGVIIMGLGVAMVFLLAFAAGVTKVAFGVGGALAIVGLAAFINGSLQAGAENPNPRA
jgi:phosphate/sulfate permease